jgi:pimeloyl-ACP methyl ester carboxylesterase
MHVCDDLMVPIALGRELEAGIPNARFVVLPGKNHVILEQDPGFAQFLKDLKGFVGPSGPA